MSTAALIGIAAGHGGFELKRYLLGELRKVAELERRKAGRAAACARTAMTTIRSIRIPVEDSWTKKCP